MTQDADLVFIGWLNPNVTLILHSDNQHQRWACKGCKATFILGDHIDGSVSEIEKEKQ